jgi:hypothetical protein
MKKLLTSWCFLCLIFSMACKKESQTECLNLKIAAFKRLAPKNDFAYKIEIHEVGMDKVFTFSDEKGDFMLNSQCDTIAQMHACCRTTCDCLTPPQFQTERSLFWKE